MKVALRAAVSLWALGLALVVLLTVPPVDDGAALPSQPLTRLRTQSKLHKDSQHGAGFYICTDHDDRAFAAGGNDRPFERDTPDVLELSSPTSPDEPSLAWTILFYDDADFSNAYDPFLSFINDAHMAENVGVLILRDTNDGPAELWQMLENRNLRILQRWGEVNMGNAVTLRRFIQFAKAHCRAERYFLAMYDHGGGWKGACTDVTDGSWLSMRAIAQGIGGAGGVDILAFTAPCIMAAMESVYELRDCVDVYIGAEDLSGYVDWKGTMRDICDLLSKSGALSNDDIGRRVIDIIESNPGWTSDPEWIWSVMGAMSTSSVVPAAQQLDIIARYLSTHTAFFLDDVEWSRARSWPLGRGANYDTKTVDVYSFTLELSERVTDPYLLQSLEELRDRLDDLIIAECHLAPSATQFPHGLSLYFPRSVDTYSTDYGEVLDMTAETSWNDFLQAYFQYQEAPRGNLAGFVTADCPAPGSPIEGVTVTARQAGTGDLLGAAVTEADGSFRIIDLVAEDYVVEAFAPLGYAVAGGGINITLPGGTVSDVDLALLCTGESNNPCGTAWWKRAIGQAMGGGGQTLLGAAEFCACLDAIDAHFTARGVAIYTSPGGSSCDEKLAVAADLLHPLPPVSTEGVARSHLMALLLNAAAGNMRTDDVISKDGATVSQAITHCYELLSIRPVDALVIANLVNSGVDVPQGWIPLTTPRIEYVPPARPALGGVTTARPDAEDAAAGTPLSVSVSPNPFNPSTTIAFNVAQSSHVTLAIYDIAGRRVATLLDRSLEPTIQRVVWDGRDENGNPVGSGVYFYRVDVGGDVAGGKLLLIK